MPASFRHVNVDNGLSNNSVRCIYQDHQGFIWLGTYDGLNRYDGNQFKVFRNRINDSTSLPYNYVNTIAEDADNNLWVGTGQGIGIYNIVTDKFAPAKYFSVKAKKQRRFTGEINCIKKDRLGNLLIGANGGGFFVKEKGGVLLLQVPYIEQKLPPRYNANVTSIAEDQRGRIWVVVADVGLCLFDRKSKTLVPVNKMPTIISCLLIDHDDVWMGTREGLLRYRIEGNTIRPYTFPQQPSLKTKHILCLMLDNSRKLWIGTQGDGVAVMDLRDNGINFLNPVRGDQSTLSSESALCMLLDRDNRKWIGTLKGGVDILDAKENPFRTVVHNPFSTNSLINNDVSCFGQSGKDSLWIGTEGAGLSLLSRPLNKFTNFVHKAGDNTSLSNNFISSVITDNRGDTWIATYGGGINKFQKATNTFKYYPCVAPGKDENKHAWIVYQDHKGTLWVSNFMAGCLFRFNRQLDRFEIFDRQLLDVIAFAEDADHHLWAGNANYLARIDERTKKHQFYIVGKPVRAIYEDKSKNFWLGTEGGGLILFDRKTGTIKARFSDQYGLCNNSVLNISQDDAGYLWLSTFNGLSRFNIKDRKFRNFYKTDGLSGNQFSYNAAIKLQSGEMAFGGIEGFTIFNPSALLRAGLTTTVPYLSAIEINHRPLKIPGKYVAEQECKTQTCLKLPFDEAVLSLGFSSIDFSPSSERAFQYRLEGWDKGWSRAEAAGMVNYTRLTEGNYQLHARVDYGGGNLGPAKVLMSVTVLPPWYREWWAYLLYAAALTLAIYKYNAYRVRQADLQYELKLISVKAEKDQELNEQKLAFFTDVSHEFRTPLTLIINPLRECLHNNSTLQQSKELNLVYSNARRLLSLVNQLLLFRKVGADADDLRIANIPLGIICRDVFNSFANQAKIKQLDFELINKAEPIKLYADREKVEVIIYNLLSNAIKFAPHSGRVAMAVTEEENEMVIRISDNGPGIPQAVGDKLFERFYQVPETKSASGLGIGLHLVKRFVDKHHGIINYESAPGAGTTFSVFFKRGLAHFSGVPIYEDITDALPVKQDADTPPAPAKGGLNDLLSDNVSKTILIVEDNHQILDYLSNVFKNEYVILTAPSGNTGLEIAKEQSPDIIISDIMMDEGTGIDLCNAIKSNPALGHIPVILLTAATDSEMKLQGTECGADDYITKPFEIDLLRARIKSLLQNRTRLQEYFYNEITLKQQDFKVPPEYAHFLKSCIRIIEQHLQDDSFNIKKLSAEIGMSHSALFRRVKMISGQSIAGFIRFIRLRKAAELMIQTNKTINEIAFEVGIGDQKYFRVQFKALFGLNPSDYIKRYRAVIYTNSSGKD